MPDGGRRTKGGSRSRSKGAGSKAAPGYAPGGGVAPPFPFPSNWPSSASERKRASPNLEKGRERAYKVERAPPAATSRATGPLPRHCPARGTRERSDGPAPNPRQPPKRATREGRKYLGARLPPFTISNSLLENTRGGRGGRWCPIRDPAHNGRPHWTEYSRPCRIGPGGPSRRGAPGREQRRQWPGRQSGGGRFWGKASQRWRTQPRRGGGSGGDTKRGRRGGEGARGHGG